MSSPPIRELLERLDKDQKSKKPQLWDSIEQLVAYKKVFYNNKLYNASTGKGLIIDLEKSQDKYITTLCNFGMTKDDIIYILSSDPSQIHSLQLPRLTDVTSDAIDDLENNIGFALRRIKDRNALDGTKMALAEVLGMAPVKLARGIKMTDRYEHYESPFDGEEAQMAWLSKTRNEKADIVSEMLFGSVKDGAFTDKRTNNPIDYNPLYEFLEASTEKGATNESQLRNLFNNYSIMKRKMKTIEDQLDEHADFFESSDKLEKLRRYSKVDTQCEGKPSFFGKQSQSDVWHYVKDENANYFSLLSEYNTIKDILEQIETIKKSINDNPDAYYQRLRESIVNFDKSVKGSARDDLKAWLRDEIFAFLDLWKVFRKKHLNMALLGPPGSGKTTIAESLGPIMSNLGILILGRYKVVSRSDLVGQYIGQTANKVKAILNSMLESVLFIDEAYAVACSKPVLPGFEGNISYDDYGIEAINEIVNHLDKNSGRIMVLVAGYERDMKYCFFGANVGLTRRFPKQYLLKNMPSSDLHLIFTSVLEKTVGDDLDNILTSGAQKCVKNLFDRTEDYWTNQAGDMVNLGEIVASKRAAKGDPLNANELHAIIGEIFSQKDLSRMQRIPDEIKPELIQNWDSDKTENFFDEQEYFEDSDELERVRGILKEIYPTGKKLAEMSQDDTRWLPPVAQYKLLSALDEEKQKSAEKIKQFFIDTSGEYCKTGKEDSSKSQIAQKAQKSQKAPNTPAKKEVKTPARRTPRRRRR